MTTRILVETAQRLRRDALDQAESPDFERGVLWALHVLACAEPPSKVADLLMELSIPPSVKG